MARIVQGERFHPEEAVIWEHNQFYQQVNNHEHK